MTAADRDRALLWLNDHLGQTVSATVSLDAGGFTATLLEVVGKLSHWRQSEEAAEIASLDPSGLRADLAGMYRVGDATLDLTDLPEQASFRSWPQVEVDAAISAVPLGFALSYGEVFELVVAPAPS